MAGVPEIEVPTAQPESTPVAAPVEAPLGAFGGAAVGAGLNEVGKELFGLGWESYHKAAEAIAQKKETEFMNGALKLRDQYRTMFNEDAIGAHEKYTKDLEALREKVGGTLSSKYALGVYNNNSLRRAGFVQESIDSHFEHENKAFQLLTHKNWQETMSRMVTAKAGEPTYNAKEIQAVINEVYEGGKKYAASLGIHGAMAEEVAINETKQPVDALFKMLLDPKAQYKRDPVLIRSELEKYTKLGMVDTGAQKDAQHALGATEAKSWVDGVIGKAIRYDYDGNPDPEGHVRYADLTKEADKLPESDLTKGLKMEELERRYARHITSYNRIGAELENTVERQGMADGGGFAIPEGSLDWQKFERLYPERAKILRAQTNEQIYKTEQRNLRSVKQASDSARGAAYYYLDLMSPEDLKEFTPAQVDQLMRDSYHGPGGPSANDKARVVEHLKKLQTGKLDPVERRFGIIAHDALAEAYKGNQTKIRAAMNNAYYILRDTYDASKGTATESDLREKLQDQFSKKDGPFSAVGLNWFGSRAGEKYVRKQRTSGQGQSIPAGWYPAPGDPSKQKYWDGKAWQ